MSYIKIEVTVYHVVLKNFVEQLFSYKYDLSIRITHFSFLKMIYNRIKTGIMGYSYCF